MIFFVNFSVAAERIPANLFLVDIGNRFTISELLKFTEAATLEGYNRKAVCYFVCCSMNLE